MILQGGVRDLGPWAALSYYAAESHLGCFRHISILQILGLMPIVFGSPSSFGLAGICYRRISRPVFSLLGSKSAVYATDSKFSLASSSHLKQAC